MDTCQIFFFKTLDNCQMYFFSLRIISFDSFYSKKKKRKRKLRAINLSKLEQLKRATEKNFLAMDTCQKYFQFKFKTFIILIYFHHRVKFLIAN